MFRGLIIAALLSTFGTISHADCRDIYPRFEIGAEKEINVGSGTPRVSTGFKFNLSIPFIPNRVKRECERQIKLDTDQALAVLDQELAKVDQERAEVGKITAETAKEYADARTENAEAAEQEHKNFDDRISLCSGHDKSLAPQSILDYCGDLIE